MAPPANVPLPGIKRINAALDGLKELRGEFDAYKAKSEQKIGILRLDMKEMTHRASILDERVSILEKELGIVYEDDEADDDANEGASTTRRRDRSATAAGATSSEANGEEGDDEEETAEGASGSVDLKSKELKNCIEQTLRLLLGCSSLSGKNLPSYPNGIDVTHELWPKDETTKKPYLRFNWSIAVQESPNTAVLTAIFNHIRAFGGSTWPPAKRILPLVSDVDLKGKILTKVKYMRSQYERNRKIREAAAAAAEAREEQLEEEEENTVEVERLERSMKNSRAESVLKQRIRKRGNSVYTDPKYDSAFILNAMSDYEDDPERIHGEEVVYIVRSPDYRSDVLKTLYQDIDSLADPDPDKAKLMTKRKKGPVMKAAEPPKAIRLVNRIRSWMVQPALLEENPNWLGKRVASSGALWDEAEPEPDEERKRRSTINGSDKPPGQKKRRLKGPTVDLSVIAGKRATLLGGSDAGEAELFGEDE